MDQGLALIIGISLSVVLMITAPWIIAGAFKIRLWLAKRRLRDVEARLAKLRELQEADD